ncbi:DUF2442 domain-containing protein [Endozoicomonas gorgoniicola]|uniref:DUF2442 domain-containing protein n=1 Tax=Endozoicomonas gorgoniicola TaxID=1234144 RepID=A0ABT3MTG6_9GAMM|nr:DUF2442 domain-containing protein [Endozoicomonas gorgoniicola]MCW7552665.1 DUF2442 domain-containing protein [Endozoicomonas gorgoniicola]
MNPSVKSVEALENFKLRVEFENNEQKVFDVEPFLEKGIFSELKNESYFKQVKVAFGSIEWPNEQDFSKDTLYILGVPVAPSETKH